MCVLEDVSLRKKKSDQQQSINIEDTSVGEANITSLQSTLEKLFDRRLDEQSKQINVMFEKYSKMTKLDLDEVKRISRCKIW